MPATDPTTVEPTLRLRAARRGARVTAVALAGVGAVLSGCLADRQVAPIVSVERTVAVAITCRVTPGSAPRTSCAQAGVGMGSNREQAAARVRQQLAVRQPSREKALVLGGQDQYLRLEPVSSSYAPDTFKVTMQLRNLLSQPMGTLDRSSPTAAGNAVFFPGGTAATVISGSGVATLTSYDSIGTGTNSGMAFVGYPGVIPAGAASAQRTWSFYMPPTVGEAEFSTLVFTTVVDSSQNGLDAGGAFVTAGTGFGGARCALRFAGSAYCWTDQNAYLGVLANGRLGYTATPVTVPGTGYTDVAVEDAHACAIRSGTVVCWGLHTMAAVGKADALPTDSNQYGLVTVGQPGGSPAVNVETTNQASCVLNQGAQVFCWGSPVYNGLNQPAPVFTPQFVLSDVLRLSGKGTRFCAIVGPGTPTQTRCWGHASTLAGVGDGTGLNRPQPTVVANPPGRWFTEIAVGHSRTCAIDNLATTWCWGMNFGGLLGTMDSTSNGVYAPDSLRNPAGVRFSRLWAGYATTCGLDSNQQPGTLLCWGDNLSSELGIGSTLSARHPVRLGAVPYADVGMGVGAVCAIQAGTRQLDCWGSNYYGETGLGTPVGSIALAPVNANVGAGIAVTSSNGGGNTCFVSVAGALRCMGYDGLGLLGTGRSFAAGTLLPQGVLGLGASVQAIATGANHTCALESAGTVSCWGYGRSYALGQGDSADRALPAPVNVGPGGALAIASGLLHTCALRAADSLVTCWGDNNSGQTGAPPSQAITLSPSVVPGVPKARALAAGFEMTCALAAADSTAWCWGNLAFGVVTPGGAYSPRAIAGSRGTRMMALGGGHICRVPSSGNGLECAGDNSFGQLGDGSVTPFRTTFAPAGNFVGSLSSVATAGSVTCATTAANNTQDGVNRLFCWGMGYVDGALGAGDAYATDSATANPNRLLIAPGTPWTQVFGNAETGLCARSTSAELWCWGIEPGDGSRRATVPVRVKLP